MEEVTTNFTKGLKGYWHEHRGYEKLNESSRRSRKRTGRVESVAADGSGQRRRFWRRLRLTPRLKLKLRRSSFKKFLIKLRDGYVRVMMKLANSRFLSAGAPYTAADAAVGFGSRPIKEYDEKMVLEIYKTIVMAQGVVPLDADKLTSRHLSLSSSAVTN